MTPAQVRELDQDEILRGYRDGIEGLQAASLEAAYQHGWNNGIADRTGQVDAEQRLFAHMYVQEKRVEAAIAKLKREAEG